MEKNKTIKTPRASQTRSTEKRPTTWTPPSSLDGKIRSGWELVRADEYPGSIYPEVKDGKYAGVIGVGGLVLARIPEEVAKSREAYFRKQIEAREEAINNDLYKDQHPSMPINNERQTRVTFGGTNKK